jgi:hypothetical protein
MLKVHKTPTKLCPVDNYLLKQKYSPTGQVVGLEVSIFRVVGSYPNQWTSMYVLVNPNLYGTG